MWIPDVRSPAASIQEQPNANNDLHWKCILYSGLGCAVRVSR